MKDNLIYIFLIILIVGIFVYNNCSNDFEKFADVKINLPESKPSEPNKTIYDIDDKDFVKVVKTYKDVKGEIHEEKEEIPVNEQISGIVKSVYKYAEDDVKINLRDIIDKNVVNTDNVLNTFQSTIKNSYNDITKLNKDTYDKNLKIYKIDIDTLIDKNNVKMQPVIDEATESLESYKKKLDDDIKNIEITKKNIYDNSFDSNYDIDVEAMRNLANISDKLVTRKYNIPNTPGLLIPSNLRIKGNYVINNVSLAKKIADVSTNAILEFQGFKKPIDDIVDLVLPYKFSTDKEQKSLNANDTNIKNVNVKNASMNTLSIDNLYSYNDNNNKKWDRRCGWFKSVAVNDSERDNLTSDTYTSRSNNRATYAVDWGNHVLMCPPQYMLNGINIMVNGWKADSIELGYCCKINDKLPDYTNLREYYLNFKQMQINYNLICGIDNMSGDIWYQSTNFDNWKRIPVEPEDFDFVYISIGQNSIAGINRMDEIIYSNSIINPVWKKSDGLLKQISLDKQGTVICGVNRSNELYYRENFNSSWIKIPNVYFNYVSICNGNLVGINLAGEIWFADNYKNPVWKNIKGGLVIADIDIVNNNIYICGINKEGNVYSVLVDKNDVNKNGFQQRGGNFKYSLSISHGKAVGINKEFDAYYAANYNDPKWAKINKL